MRPVPSYFHIQASTNITLNERFSRINQKGSKDRFTPPVQRGGIQKPRGSNIRDMRGRLNKTTVYQQPQLANQNEGNQRGFNSGRPFKGFASRGVRGFTNNVNSRGFATARTSPGRGNFTGRGVNLRRGGSNFGRGTNRTVAKTPEKKKEELDAELDSYMRTE